MTLAAEALPDDPETLKAMLIAERIRSERLAQIIKDMQRHRFGRRAEALPADQLLLALEDAEQSQAEAAAEAEAKSPPKREEARRKRRANRGALPSHLPRSRRPSTSRARPARAAAANCTGSAKRSARSSTSFPRSSACWSCGGPNTPAAPARTLSSRRRRRRELIEGGLPTEALVAQVLVSKYADGLPLYRQAQIYDRHGFDSTARRSPTGSAGRRSTAADPRRAFSPHLRSSTKLFADETTAPCLIPAEGGQRPASSGPMRETIARGAARTRPPSPMSTRPTGRRRSRSCTLQDSRAFSRSTVTPDIVRWLRRATSASPAAGRHVRRRFYDRAVAEASPIAHEALQRIALLYAIEKGHSRALSRRTARRSPGTIVSHSRRTRTLAAREARAHQQEEQTRRGDPLRAPRWEGLCRFLDDGRVEIDSNTVERSIRPLAKRVSLCSPSLSVCKHWKRVRVGSATRAALPGHRGFHRFRHEVGGAYLMRRARNDLHGRKDVGLYQAPYRVACDA